MWFLPDRSRYKLLVGEVFKAHGIINEGQLQQALMLQRHKSKRMGQNISLGMILVELGYAQEEQLIEAINNHYRLSVTSVSDNIEEQIEKRRQSPLEKLPSLYLPIWLQLSAATTLIIVLTIFLLSYVVFNRQKEQLYQETVKIGMVSLNYFVNNAGIPLLEDNILRLNTLIKEAAAMEGILYAVIVDQKREIKAHTNHNKIGLKFEGFSNIEKVTRKGNITYFDYILPSGRHVLSLTRPVVFKNTNLGRVHVGVSIDFIDDLINSTKSSIIGISLFVILLGILVALLLGYGFSRPISKLVRATREIAKGNYSYKVNLSRNDELGNLAKTFNQMSDELWREALMHDSFGKYVGPEVLEMIMDNPASKWLKGRKGEGTVIFADIRGFTSFSETKEPEEVVEKLNEYFEIASQGILGQGGYIDKFIGDAVLGVFGVPVYRADHVQSAVRAAIDIQNNLKRASENGNRLLARIGISINSGIVVSGNIGSQIKMEYTVIGDSVNVASRLNKLAGPGEIIISKNVYEQVGDLITVEKLPPQTIKGKSEPIETFRVLNYNYADEDDNGNEG